MAKFDKTLEFITDYKGVQIIMFPTYTQPKTKFSSTVFDKYFLKNSQEYDEKNET